VSLASSLTSVTTRSFDRIFFDVGLLPDVHERHRLTRGWNKTVFVGWVGFALALALVGASSQMIGRPAWWADDTRWSGAALVVLILAVFALPTAVALWAFFAGPWLPWLSGAASLLVALLAFTDRDSSPAAALVTGVLALSMLLLSIGSWSGRRANERGR